MFGVPAEQAVLKCKMCVAYVLPVQGFAVQLHMKDSADSDKVWSAIMAVLSEKRYTTVARQISKQLRSRKHSPVQEAAGEGNRNSDSAASAELLWVV